MTYTTYEIRNEDGNKAAQSDDFNDAKRIADGLRQNTGFPHRVFRVETTMLWEGQSLAEKAEEAAWNRAARDFAKATK